AYELHKLLNDKVGMSYGLDYMASVYSEMGQHQKALEYLLQSRDLKKGVDDKMGEAIITNNIGEALLQKGDRSGALIYFRNAREMAERLGFTDLEAHTWNMEASVFESKGEFANAFLTLKKYQE